MAAAGGDRPASVVFIYGPPGVGKLTVAREVCALTSYRLFDNHMAIDWAHQIFPGSSGGFEHDAYARLRDRLRLAVFEAAALARVGIVTTYVYAAGLDDAYVRDMCGPVEAQGGRVCFVRLSCEADVHAERVASPGRHEAGKLSTPERLREVMATYSLTAPIAGRGSLHVDTTTSPPAEAARRIVDHFALG